MPSRWEFRAYDLATGAALGSLPVVRWSHTERLNQAGEFTCTLGTDDDDIAREAIGATLAARAVIVPYRDGMPVGFGGIVWRPNYPELGGGGLFSYFDAQTLDATKVFAAVDQHQMVVDLVDWVQSHDGNIRVVTSDIAASGFPRDQTWFVWEEKNIGEAIRQKAAIINGYDFDVAITPGANNEPIRQLRLWTPRRGRTYEEGISPVFTLAGTRANVLEVPDMPRDGLKAVTHIYAVGAEIPDTDLAPNPNRERIVARTIRTDLLDAGWPRLAIKLDLPDVKELPTLQQHADGYAAQYGGAATDIVTLHVDPDHGTWGSGTWDIGDDCHVGIPAGVARWLPDGMAMKRRIVARTWTVEGAAESQYIDTEGDIDIDTDAPPTVIIVPPPDVPPPVIVPPDPPPSPGPTGDGYIEFSGVTGNYVACADDAADPTGDITVVIDVAAADWSPAALQTIVGKYISTTNQRSWESRLEVNGAPSFGWSSNGTSVTPTTGGTSTSGNTALGALPALSRVQLAYALDVNNGASSNTARFSFLPEGSTPVTNRLLATNGVYPGYAETGRTNMFTYETYMGAGSQYKFVDQNIDFVAANMTGSMYGITNNTGAWQNNGTDDARHVRLCITVPLRNASTGNVTVDAGVAATIRADLIAASGGSMDSKWTICANYLLNGGHGDAILRIGHEGEIEWYPWSFLLGNADVYKTAFQRCVSVFKGISSSFQVDYNVDSDANLAYSGFANALEAGYPGDSYVDIIGVDMYNRGSWATQLSKLNQVQAFAVTRSKMFSVPEWGLWKNETGDDVTYIENMAAFFTGLPTTGPGRLVYQGYFWNFPNSNFDSTTISGTPYSAPNAKAKYKELFFAATTGGWTPLGTKTGSDTATAFTTAIFNSTSPIAVGGINAGALRPFVGRVYDVSVRTGISGTDTPGGTEVAGIRSADIPADNGVTGAGQTFTSAGRTWTVNRAGSASSDTLLVPTGVTPGEPTPSLTGFFPIGVKDQPADAVTISKWLAAGCNTFVGVPAGTTVDSWSDAIEADRRVYQIRAPRPALTDDVISGVPVQKLLAWKHPDRPDLFSAQIGSETLQATYATWNAVTGHPPVLVMVTGRMDSQDAQTYSAGDNTTFGALWYGEYFEAADWIGEDRLPVNQDGALVVGGVSLVGEAVDKLNTWSANSGKPRFAYIECADANTSDANAAPTPDQMRGEIWSAIIHGARGIVYVPQRTVPAPLADGSTVALRDEMTTQNSRITGLQAALQNPINPVGFSATVPFPMEVGWRATSTHRYFIVLNLSGATRTSQAIALSGAGGATSAEVYGETRTVGVSSNQIVDTFGPYACHIYKLAISADPPPNTGGTTINVSSTTAGAIATAIASANPGDTVLIANGTYPPIVTSKVSSGVGVTVQGASEAGVIINGGIVSTGAQYITWSTLTVSGSVTGTAYQKAGIFLQGTASHHQTFDNLTVKPTSGPLSDSCGCLSIWGGAHHITINNCDLDANLTTGGQSRSLFLYGEGGVTSETNWCHDLVITNNLLRNAATDCVFLYGAYNVRFELNTFGPTKVNADAETNDQIQLLRGWHDISIINNTFNGECNGAIQVNGKNDSLSLVAYGLTIQNNTGVNLQHDGLVLGGAQSGTISGNDFSDTDNGTGTGFGLVLWGGEPETAASGALGAPAGSVMGQNRNMQIVNNTFGTKSKAVGDQTANGVNGNVCTGNDLTI